MAIQLPNPFTSFEFEDEREFLQARLLTIAQRQNIQNELSICAMNRLTLEPDPTNLHEYIQKEAYQRGQQEAYQYLLDCADSAEDTIRSQATQQP